MQEYLTKQVLRETARSDQAHDLDPRTAGRSRAPDDENGAEVIAAEAKVAT